TWDHNLVRQLIDEEDVNLVLNTKINLSRADKLIWGFSKNGRYDVKSGGSVPEKWQKPPASFLKCNVGSSLDEGSSIAGAAWVVRDTRGIVLLHSRRAFANVSSLQQANVMALHWAAEAMSDLKFKKVVLNSQLLRLKRQWIIHFFVLPVSHALSAIYSIRDAKISYVTSSCNLIANLIAVSVTRDQRYQSYVARNGPAWLATQIGQEASA
ncbi:hypothetical protein HID58_093008, partial [Brassica napus]